MSFYKHCEIFIIVQASYFYKIINSFYKNFNIVYIMYQHKKITIHQRTNRFFDTFQFNFAARFQYYDTFNTI